MNAVSGRALLRCRYTGKNEAPHRAWPRQAEPHRAEPSRAAPSRAASSRVPRRRALLDQQAACSAGVPVVAFFPVPRVVRRRNELSHEPVHRDRCSLQATVASRVDRLLPCPRLSSPVFGALFSVRTVSRWCVPRHFLEIC